LCGWFGRGETLAAITCTSGEFSWRPPDLACFRHMTGLVVCGLMVSWGGFGPYCRRWAHDPLRDGTAFVEPELPCRVSAREGDCFASVVLVVLALTFVLVKVLAG